MVKMCGLIALALLAGSPSAYAGDLWLEDIVGPYLLRIEGVTESAGNAKDTNAAIHTVDPWTVGVGDRRIPANGPRMVGAIERYQDVRRLRREALPPIAPLIAPSSTLSGGGGGTSGVTGFSQ